MRIEPRQHLLATWKATVAASWRNDTWQWGGRGGSNSISDAEQLLCILLPATKVPTFALDRPNTTAIEMVDALALLGNEQDIPQRLVDIATAYFKRYMDVHGRPVFGGGSYFQSDDGGQLNESQMSRDIVDSFAISVTLSLSTIGFVRIFRQAVTGPELRARLRELEQLASVRLTAAMVGLLRSFSTHVFEASSEPGRILVKTLNKGGQPSRQVISDFRASLQETIASFNEVLIGSGQTGRLQGSTKLFECGWSWGIVRGAPAIALEPASELKETHNTIKLQGPAGKLFEYRPVIDGIENIGNQPEGVAENKPYLYFTVVAVDAIEDLFSERTRVLGLLNSEQQRLARALQLRWDLTLTYWATVATFGNGGQWPLEDPPWQTTDLQRSEYYTLLVTSIVVKDLVRRRGSDADLIRIGAVLADLANEGRVTRQHRPGDSGIRLHAPGLEVVLEEPEPEPEPENDGSAAADQDASASPPPEATEVPDDATESKSKQVWRIGEFASLLLQRSIMIGGLLHDVEERARLLNLADRVWDHLTRRRLASGRGARLWDQPANVFEGLEEFTEPSWYYTERVIQCLISTANLVSQEPLVDDQQVREAERLLSEAEHLYDTELMRGSFGASQQEKDVLTKIRIKLQRARTLVTSRPGTAGALCMTVLTLLDELNAARESDSVVS
ncbi:SCO2524 family protein [Actinoplanes sp. NPDC020271]|uniref:SCO2524 family protein n=1 Tax=Actinoplanes sp. NPDC020271 TaxID=3363896 RepID=UPI0037A92762